MREAIYTDPQLRTRIQAWIYKEEALGELEPRKPLAENNQSGAGSARIFFFHCEVPREIIRNENARVF